MKWLGQYIQSFTARFRNDVYLENLSTTTETSALVVDSDGKISKNVTSGVNLTNGVDNRVVTAVGTNGLNAEANLTFDGTDLTIASAGKVEFRDANSYMHSPTANDLEIVGTDIVLDAATSISLEIGDDEVINLKNGSNIFGFFTAEDGAGSELTLYERGGTTDADYFSISTTEHGATLLRTWDNNTTAAHFEIAANGNITLDAAGTTTIESAGLIKLETSEGGVEIENGAASAALLIDNNSADQVALDIDADNTTANIIDIDATALTTGKAIHIDSANVGGGSSGGGEIKIDKDVTSSSIQLHDGMIELSAVKASVTGDGSISQIKGISSSITDTASNVGSVWLTNLEIGTNLTNAPSGSGTIGFVRGITNHITGTTTGAHNMIGYLSNVANGSPDIRLQSSSDPTTLSSGDNGDYCDISTGASGATTIKTNDDSGAGADFEVAADGDIILDANGDINLEPKSGGKILLDGAIEVDGGSVTGITTLGVDSVNLTAVQTSVEPFVDNNTSIMTSAAINDRITNKYSFAYMTWSASGTSSMAGEDSEWVFPHINKGVYEEDWNADENITATTVGATTFDISRHSAVNGFVVPHVGECVGFHAHGRNGTADKTFKAGLFHLQGSTAGASNGTGVDYGHTGDTHEATLRWIATAVETEASEGSDGTSSHNFKGPCKLVSNQDDSIAIGPGDVLLPAIMGDNEEDEIFVTMTIILKIPLTDADD